MYEVSVPKKEEEKNNYINLAKMKSRMNYEYYGKLK